MLNDIKVGSTIALRSLRRGNKKTAFFTIFVLSLIFVNMIFLPSMINGMSDIFVEQVTDYGYGNIIIEPTEDNTYINNADSILKKVNSISGVVAGAKRLGAGATLSYNEKYLGTTLLGVVPEEEALVSKFQEVIVEGEYLSGMSRDEIVLGRLLAGEVGGPEVYEDLGGVDPGQMINVTYSNGIIREYKLKGIHEGGSEIADMTALIHYKEIEDILGLTGQHKASNIIIKTEVFGDEAIVKERLINVGINEEIYTWQEKVLDLIRDFLRSFGVLGSLSRVVSLIIAAFVLFIIIYINTLHRKKQIGILRAVGITPKSIIFSYLFLSLIYIFLGIIFGGILLFLIILYLTANPIHFFGSMYLTPKVDFSAVINGVVGLIIMSLVAGFIPAWLVTKEKILDAIWER